MDDTMESWIVDSSPASVICSFLLCLSFPRSTASFTPLSLSLFSCTYELPNLQALCFQIFTTVGGYGWGGERVPT
jgi:hypothetical protein